MDRLWSEFTSASPVAPWAGGGWSASPVEGRFPAVNISETADAIVIEAELPGLKASDLDVSVAGDELVLKGSRPEPEAPLTEAPAGPQPEAAKPNGHSSQSGWLRRERGTGAFERRIELPVAIDPQKVEARLADGVLTLRCLKAAECQPHKIVVRS